MPSPNIEEIHVGDIGTVFRITLYDGGSIVDASEVTSKTIQFKGPQGNLSVKEASFFTDGADGIIQYTTVSGDLSVPGRWKFQVILEFPSGHWSSSIGSFMVYENLGS